MQRRRLFPCLAVVVPGVERIKVVRLVTAAIADVTVQPAIIRPPRDLLRQAGILDVLETPVLVGADAVR